MIEDIKHLCDGTYCRNEAEVCYCNGCLEEKIQEAFIEEKKEGHAEGYDEGYAEGAESVEAKP